jgi:hypothetical protein
MGDLSEGSRISAELIQVMTSMSGKPVVGIRKRNKQMR